MGFSCSVVITTCDRRDHLARAIGSVLRQTRLPTEIVVVDDRSEYDVPAMVAGLGESPVPIRVVVQPVRSGAPTARNAGAAASSGDVLMFLDDDDQWAPTKIARQMDVLEASPETGWAYTGMQSVSLVNDSVTHRSRDHVSGDVWPEILFRNFVGPTSAVAIRRDAFDAVGGFDPAFPALQDYELWVRLAQAFPVAYDGGHGLLFSAEHPPGYQRISSNIANYRRAYATLRRKHAPALSRLSSADRRRFIANSRLVLTGKQLLAGHYAGAAANFLSAAVAWPPTLTRAWRSLAKRRAAQEPSASPADDEDRAFTVSVVIPAYNRADTIAAAVRSALEQTRPADEILVVDDGSRDDLAGALAPFGDRVTLIRHIRNQGAAAARNTGIRSARGNYIAFLDSDDYWVPEKLGRQIAFMQAGGYDFCCTGFYVDGEPVDRPFRERITLQDLVWGCYLSPGSTMIASRAALLGLGGYEVACRRLEDWDLLLRASVAGHRMGFLATRLAHVFPSPGGSGDALRESLAMLRQRHIPTLGAKAFSLKWQFQAALSFTAASVYYQQRRWARMYLSLLASWIRVPVNNRSVKVVMYPKLRRKMAGVSRSFRGLPSPLEGETLAHRKPGS